MTPKSQRCYAMEVEKEHEKSTEEDSENAKTDHEHGQEQDKAPV